MSMTIVFQPCQFSGKQVVKKNPFTGKEQITHPTVPLTESQMQSIRLVLSKYTTDNQHENAEIFAITFGNRGYWSIVEVDVSGLANGCTIMLRGETPDLYPFLFEVLRSADWMIVASQLDVFGIVESFERLKNVPPDYMKIAQCASPEQLGKLLRW